MQVSPPLPSVLCSSLCDINSEDKAAPVRSDEPHSSNSILALLPTVFSALDADGDGYISLTDCDSAMMVANTDGHLNLYRPYLISIFDAADKDSDECLSWKEFLNSYTEGPGLFPQEVLTSMTAKIATRDGAENKLSIEDRLRLVLTPLLVSTSPMSREEAKGKVYSLLQPLLHGLKSSLDEAVDLIMSGAVENADGTVSMHEAIDYATGRAKRTVKAVAKTTKNDQKKPNKDAAERHLIGDKELFKQLDKEIRKQKNSQIRSDIALSDVEETNTTKQISSYGRQQRGFGTHVHSRSRGTDNLTAGEIDCADRSFEMKISGPPSQEVLERVFLFLDSECNGFLGCSVIEDLLVNGTVPTDSSSKAAEYSGDKSEALRLLARLKFSRLARNHKDQLNLNEFLSSYKADGSDVLDTYMPKSREEMLAVAYNSFSGLLPPQVVYSVHQNISVNLCIEDKRILQKILADLLLGYLSESSIGRCPGDIDEFFRRVQQAFAQNVALADDICEHAQCITSNSSTKSADVHAKVDPRDIAAIFNIDLSKVVTDMQQQNSEKYGTGIALDGTHHSSNSCDERKRVKLFLSPFELARLEELLESMACASFITATQLHERLHEIVPDNKITPLKNALLLSRSGFKSCEGIKYDEVKGEQKIEVSALCGAYKVCGFSFFGLSAICPSDTCQDMLGFLSSTPLDEEGYFLLGHVLVHKDYAKDGVCPLLETMRALRRALRTRYPCWSQELVTAIVKRILNAGVPNENGEVSFSNVICSFYLRFMLIPAKYRADGAAALSRRLDQNDIERMVHALRILEDDSCGEEVHKSTLIAALRHAEWKPGSDEREEAVTLLSHQSGLHEAMAQSLCGYMHDIGCSPAHAANTLLTSSKCISPPSCMMFRLMEANDCAAVCVKTLCAILPASALRAILYTLLLVDDGGGHAPRMATTIALHDSLRAVFSRELAASERYVLAHPRSVQDIENNSFCNAELEDVNVHRANYKLLPGLLKQLSSFVRLIVLSMYELFNSTDGVIDLFISPIIEELLSYGGGCVVAAPQRLPSIGLDFSYPLCESAEEGLRTALTVFLQDRRGLVTRTGLEGALRKTLGVSHSGLAGPISRFICFLSCPLEGDWCDAKEALKNCEVCKEGIRFILSRFERLEAHRLTSALIPVANVRYFAFIFGILQQRSLNMQTPFEDVPSSLLPIFTCPSPDEEQDAMYVHKRLENFLISFMFSRATSMVAIPRGEGKLVVPSPYISEEAMGVIERRWSHPFRPSKGRQPLTQLTLEGPRPGLTENEHCLVSLSSSTTVPLDSKRHTVARVVNPKKGNFVFYHFVNADESAVSEEELAAIFDEFPYKKKDGIDREKFQNTYEHFEYFGVKPTHQEITTLFNKVCGNSEVVTFDQFALIMLKRSAM